jgi:hypothetical protein
MREQILLIKNNNSNILNNTVQTFHMVANGNTIQKVSKKKDNTSD